MVSGERCSASLISYKQSHVPSNNAGRRKFVQSLVVPVTLALSTGCASALTEVVHCPSCCCVVSVSMQEEELEKLRREAARIQGLFDRSTCACRFVAH